MELLENLLSLFGGLALFLFGMSLMGQGLELRAGSRLKGWLSKLTSGRFRGLLLGAAVTALIQSSSAVTVMAVGFVNSGLLSLSQVTGVIMGANIGTTATAWLVSLTQINGSGILLQLLKPTSFTPILALIGIICYLFSKKDTRKSTGGILLGFAVLIYGMNAMSDAVKPLAEYEGFRAVLLWFDNPFFGLLAGTLLTAILQSSSASLGILQAISGTGQLALGTALPIIMGQNIGTCATALLSAIGTGKNAKRTAAIHLYFNLIGSGILLTVFLAVRRFLPSVWVYEPINAAGIALMHTVFNVLCTILLYPAAPLLVRLAERTVPDREREQEKEGTVELLDPRFLASPTVAVEQSRSVAAQMAKLSAENTALAFSLLRKYDGETFRILAEREKTVDRMEDSIGTYLVAISGLSIGETEGLAVTALLHQLGDWERIADHAWNIGEAARALNTAQSALSETAKRELAVFLSALEEILSLTLQAFCEERQEAAEAIEPLEDVIDSLHDELRERSVERLRCGTCAVEVGFLFTDLLTDLERIADHCTNIAQILLSVPKGEVCLHGDRRQRPSSERAHYEACRRLYTDRFALS